MQTSSEMPTLFMINREPQIANTFPTSCLPAAPAPGNGWVYWALLIICREGGNRWNYKAMFSAYPFSEPVSCFFLYTFKIYGLEYSK